MPKNKTHKGVAKRVKITGSGKTMRERAGRRHLLEKKSSRVTRRLYGNTDVDPADVRRLRKLLGR